VTPPRLDLSRADWRGSVVTTAGVLAAFFSAWLIEDLAGLHSSVVVLAVMLAMSFGRVHRAYSAAGDLLATAILVGVSLVSVGVGWLLVHHEIVGDTLFVLALAFAIWLRRYGPRPRRIGTLINLPFIALLVAPGDGSFQPSHLFWTALVAVIATGWVLVLRALAARTGFVAGRLAPPGQLVVPRAPKRDRSWADRLQPSDKMAVQMALGLAIAFALGHWWFGELHWPWVVVTAYVVAAGNRGRGEVIHKSWQRVVGALVGTAVASAIAVPFDRGERLAIALIFLVLFVATWLRAVSYAIWAGCVTACLALLYAYEGISGGEALRMRLEAICVGAVIAVLVAWFVFPIRTRDVARRRIADALAVLSDLLTAARGRDPAEVAVHAARWQLALTQLEEVRPTLAARLRMAPLPLVEDEADQPIHVVSDLLDAGPAVEGFVETVQSCPAVLRDPTINAALIDLHDEVTAARRSLRSEGGAGKR